jgi:transcription elongation factor SPT6
MRRRTRTSMASLAMASPGRRSQAAQMASKTPARRKTTTTKTGCDRQAQTQSHRCMEVLTGSQEGEGFIADEDEEEDDVAERKRRRRRKRKEREEEDVLDDEDLDLIGLEVERPAEEQVRHESLLEPVIN